MSMDTATSRALFSLARVSDRYLVANDPAMSGLCRAFDAQLPRDPHYPAKQLVRSSYLAPIDQATPRSSFLRVREYLGPVDGSQAGQATAFLELKHVAANGTKHKERIPVIAGAVERLRAQPTSDTLRRVVLASAPVEVVARGVALLDSTPHYLEPGTEYGRIAWEDAASTLRLTVDEVAAAGTSLARHGSVKRVLEVKYPGGEPPTWTTAVLDDASNTGRIARIVPGSHSREAHPTSG